jgi:hypothetical protein
MVAEVNFCGSIHHRWFRGTKQECLEWLRDKGTPQTLIPEKRAAKCRYQDGTLCYPRWNPGEEPLDDRPTNSNVNEYPPYCD